MEIKSETNCPTCGSKCTIASGDGNSNYFIPETKQKTPDHFKAMTEKLRMFYSDEEVADYAKWIAAELYASQMNQSDLVSQDIKIEFIVDDKFKSKHYSIMDLLELNGEDQVIENMEVCDCSLNESVAYCDGGCSEFENSQITGFNIIQSQQPMSIAWLSNHEIHIISLEYGDDDTAKHAMCRLQNELKKRVIDPVDIAELKKQNEELVEALKNAKNDLQWTWDNMGTPHTSDHFNIPANGIHQIEELLSKYTT